MQRNGMVPTFIRRGVLVLATHRQIKAIRVGRAPHGMALRPEVGRDGRR